MSMRIAATVALMLLTGCAGTSSSPSVLTATQPSLSAKQHTLVVGETVDFRMYTHCGVQSTRINGRVWNAMDPLYSSPDRLGPPPGWGDPEQDGRLTLEASDRAVFAAVGEQVVLVPSETGEALVPCD